MTSDEIAAARKEIHSYSLDKFIRISRAMAKDFTPRLMMTGTEVRNAGLAIERLCDEVERKLKWRLVAVQCPKCKSNIEISGQNMKTKDEP